MEVLSTVALITMTGFSLFTLYVMVLYPLYRISIDFWNEKLKKGGTNV